MPVEKKQVKKKEKAHQNSGKKSNLIRTNIILSEDVKLQVQTLALKYRLSLSEIIRRALLLWLKERK